MILLFIEDLLAFPEVIHAGADGANVDTSLPPPSTSINPKPFCPMNHFTVPVLVIVNASSFANDTIDKALDRSPPAAVRSPHGCAVKEIHVRLTSDQHGRWNGHDALGSHPRNLEG